MMRSVMPSMIQDLHHVRDDPESLEIATDTNVEPIAKTVDGPRIQNRKAPDPNRDSLVSRVVRQSAGA